MFRHSLIVHKSIYSFIYNLGNYSLRDSYAFVTSPSVIKNKKGIYSFEILYSNKIQNFEKIICIAMHKIEVP